LTDENREKTQMNSQNNFYPMAPSKRRATLLSQIQMLLLLLAGGVSLASQASAEPAEPIVEGSVPRDGFNLHYTAEGSGRPIVFLSGGPGIQVEYMKGAAALFPSRYQKLFLEQRGTGRSRPPVLNSSNVTLRLMVEDLEALRLHLDQDKLLLAGHSWGGMLAMAYAAAFPDRIGRMILIDSGGPNAEFNQWFPDSVNARLRPEDKELTAYWTKAAERGVSSEKVRTEQLRIITPAYFFDRAQGTAFAAQIKDGDQVPQVFELIWADLRKINYNVIPGLAKVTSPVLIIHGHQDPIGQKTAETIHAAISSSTLQYIRRCGHFPWIEQPTEFRKIVADFLAPETASHLSPGAASGQGASYDDVHGIERKLMDPQVAPGDDFFRYANGRWLENTPIPPDRPAWGVFSQLAQDVDARVHALLAEPAARNAPAGTDARKAADFFATFMDEDGIEALGLKPLKAELDQIATITNRAALAQALGEDLRADVDPLNNTEFHTTRLFGLWVSPDFNHAGRNAAYLLQGGLGLPDRDYYLSGKPRMARIREQYQAYIVSLLTKAGWDEAPARAARIVALETAIARVHATRQESEDTRRANNPWPRPEFSQRAPGLDWPAFLAAAGLEHVDTLIVWHPGAIAGIATLAANEPLESWRDWMRFHALDRAAPCLPRALVAEHFAFHDRILNGTPELPMRWKRGVRAVNAAVGFAVGKLYTDRYFPASSKQQLEAMTAKIITAFGKRIDALTWMAPATKARAREKLTTLRVGIGYPDRWPDYSGLEIVPGDAVGNEERAELFHFRQQREKIGRAVDTGEWWMVPQVVNAVNLPLQNAINFPAGILQPPFFDPVAPDAVNYGGTGLTIGHEISHSFDDQGAQFDAHGALVDWWTAEDRTHFEEAGRKLALQFDAYTPFPDAHVNGTLTLSENIADLAGLAVAYDAWQTGLGSLRLLWTVLRDRSSSSWPMPNPGVRSVARHPNGASSSRTATRRLNFAPTPFGIWIRGIPRSMSVLNKSYTWRPSSE
jgi:putative endopeptidase